MAACRLKTLSTSHFPAGWTCKRNSNDIAQIVVGDGKHLFVISRRLKIVDLLRAFDEA